MTGDLDVGRRLGDPSLDVKFHIVDLYDRRPDYFATEWYRTRCTDCGTTHDDDHDGTLRFCFKHTCKADDPPPIPEEHLMAEKPEGRTPEPDKADEETRHYYVPDLEAVRNADKVLSFVPCKTCGNHETADGVHLPYQPLRYKPRPAPEPIDPDGPYDHSAAEARVQEHLDRLNAHREVERDWTVSARVISDRINVSQGRFDVEANREASADPLRTHYTEHPFLGADALPDDRHPYSMFEYDDVLDAERAAAEEAARRAREEAEDEAERARRAMSEKLVQAREAREAEERRRAEEREYRLPRPVRWIRRMLRRWGGLR